MKLGIKAGVPIVPIAINGTYNVLEANGRKIKAADVDLIICPPIYPNELSKEEQNNLSATIKDIIQKELEKQEIKRRVSQNRFNFEAFSFFLLLSDS